MRLEDVGGVRRRGREREEVGVAEKRREEGGRELVLGGGALTVVEAEAMKMRVDEV